MRTWATDVLMATAIVVALPFAAQAEPSPAAKPVDPPSSANAPPAVPPTPAPAAGTLTPPTATALPAAPAPTPMPPPPSPPPPQPSPAVTPEDEAMLNDLELLILFDLMAVFDLFADEETPP